MSSKAGVYLKISLQYLRGVAAVLVVAFHASEPFGLDFGIGSAGVDIFFVISGYLMWMISDAKTRPLRFMKNRVQRIVPPYWVATTFVVVAALVGIFPRTRLEPAHVLASYLFIPYRSPNNGHLWPLLVPGWTLNYEMFFYALFASVLAVPSSWRLSVLTVSFVALALVGLLFEPGGLPGFYLDSIILEFAAGVLLAEIHRRREGRAADCDAGRWFLLVGFAAFAAQAFVACPVARVLHFGVPALLVVHGALMEESRAAGIPGAQTLRLLGDASYSIYLWHALVVSGMHRLLSRLGLSAMVAVALTIVCAVSLGVLALVAVERPILAWTRRRSADPPTQGREPS